MPEKDFDHLVSSVKKFNPVISFVSITSVNVLEITVTIAPSGLTTSVNINSLIFTAISCTPPLTKDHAGTVFTFSQLSLSGLRRLLAEDLDFHDQVHRTLDFCHQQSYPKHHLTSSISHVKPSILNHLKARTE